MDASGPLEAAGGTRTPFEDGKRAQVVFGPQHTDTLEFDVSLRTFKQLIRGGPNSLEGKLVSSLAANAGLFTTSQKPWRTKKGSW